MTPRHALIEDFITAQGWAGASRRPLAGDASARHYQRMVAGERRAILMDAPPESGLDVGPFVAVTRWLRRNGLSAPEILGADCARGLLLLEDLGDDLFATICLRAPARESGLYAAAIDLLADFQALDPPGAAESWCPPRYDMAVLMREIRLAPEWYLTAATGQEVSPELAAEFDALAAAVLTPLIADSNVPIYRDYHAENLIWLPGRAGHARIGLLDYQDMLIGHPAYDFVSLLGDARRDISPELRDAMLTRYLARTGHPRAQFDLAAHVLSAQRNLKILGLFTRLCRRDGKPRYLDYLPRVWRYLRADLEHPELSDLRLWIERHLPAPERAVCDRIAASGA